MTVKSPRVVLNFTSYFSGAFSFNVAGFNKLPAFAAGAGAADGAVAAGFDSAGAGTGAAVGGAVSAGLVSASGCFVLQPTSSSTIAADTHHMALRMEFSPFTGSSPLKSAVTFCYSFPGSRAQLFSLSATYFHRESCEYRSPNILFATA